MNRVNIIQNFRTAESFTSLVSVFLLKEVFLQLSQGNSRNKAYIFYNQHILNSFLRNMVCRATDDCYSCFNGMPHITRVLTSVLNKIKLRSYSGEVIKMVFPMQYTCSISTRHQLHVWKCRIYNMNVLNIKRCCKHSFIQNIL